MERPTFKHKKNVMNLINSDTLDLIDQSVCDHQIKLNAYEI